MSDSCDSKMVEIMGHLNNVIEILKKDDFLDSCIKKLKEQTLEIVFDEDNPQKFAGENISNTHGIYMFWADFSKWVAGPCDSLQALLESFEDKWNNKNGCEKCINFPQVYKTRVENLIKQNKGNEPVVAKDIPFYLGKAEKVAKRIKDHFNLEATNTTYALKLNARAESLKGIKFKVAWLPFDVSDDEYFVVSKIESLLRDKLNPIIGKQ